MSPTSIARAGNVIGGGDWASDRLIPDIVRAIVFKEDLIIRLPRAIRPWQHVLDCLNGYIILIEKMLDGEAEVLWNFGPTTESFIEVEQVINKFLVSYGDNCNIIIDKRENIAESINLRLDSTKSRTVLGWEDKLDIDLTISLTAKWYQDFYNNKNPLNLTLNQVEFFLNQ